MSEPLTDEQIRELLALEGVATLRQWDESWASRHMTLLPVDRRLAIAARNALPELLAEIVRLRAIVEEINEYAHHERQAVIDWADGEVDPRFYDDSFEEKDLAEKHLNRAVELAAQAAKEKP